MLVHLLCHQSIPLLYPVRLLQLPVTYAGILLRVASCLRGADDLNVGNSSETLHTGNHTGLLSRWYAQNGQLWSFGVQFGGCIRGAAAGFGRERGYSISRGTTRPETICQDRGTCKLGKPRYHHSLMLSTVQFVGYNAYARQVNVLLRDRRGNRELEWKQPTKGRLAIIVAREVKKFVVRLIPPIACGSILRPSISIPRTRTTSSQRFTRGKGSSFFTSISSRKALSDRGLVSKC